MKVKIVNVNIVKGPDYDWDVPAGLIRFDEFESPIYQQILNNHMTPEEYIKAKVKYALEVRLEQLLKDTWNEALTQAEGVLPDDIIHTEDIWGSSPYMYKDKQVKKYREQSLQAIDKLKLK